MFNVIEIDNLNVVHWKKTVKAKLESRASKSKSAKKNCFKPPNIEGETQS